jgi:uncharacterized protein YjbJ (UPF0337 family)
VYLAGRSPKRPDTTRHRFVTRRGVPGRLVARRRRPDRDDRQRRSAYEDLPMGSTVDMSSEDKISNKIDEMAGKGKEAAGRATDNPDLEAEGKGEEAKGNLKQAGEKVKDAFK